MSAATAPQPAGEIRYIPLQLLQRSPRNVRKTASSSIAQLAATIRAHGLRQNLNVTAVGDHFEVEAGERRRQALVLLAEQGAIPADFQVPCMVADLAAAGEISLAENTMREAMHPADQFEAFRQLLEVEKKTEAEVAERFSVTVTFLRQRMKLANVSPVILKAYRAGKLSLEAVEAYAITNDHARQERAYKAGVTYPHNIRHTLTKGEVRADDRRVQFVGLAAYEAAGGALRRDLFATDNDAAAYVADEKLLDRLVAEKLEAEAAKLRAEGYAWVEARPDLDEWKWPRSNASKPDQAKLGALVRIGYRGEILVDRNRLRPGQRDTASGKASGKASGAAKPARKPGALSFAQLQQLQAQRNAVLSCTLGRAPRIALAALAASLASSVLGWRVDALDRLVRVHKGDQYQDRVPLPLREILAAAPAAKQLEQDLADFRKGLPSSGSLFAWLIEQPEATTHRLLALCAGRQLNAIEIVPGADLGAKFGALVDLDMAKQWKVTPAWLAQQPTAYLVHAVSEACGKAGAAELARCKGKAATVAKAAQLLGTIAGWVPAPFRTASSKTGKAKPAVAKRAAAKPKARAAKAPAKKAAKAKRGAK